MENVEGFYYRLITESSPQLISWHDPQGIFLYASSASQQLTGYKSNDLVGHSVYEFLHPNDSDMVRSGYASALLRLAPYTMHYRFRHKDGSYVWLETAGRVIDPPGGQGRQLLSFSHDITDSKHVEDTLRILAHGIGAVTGPNPFYPLVSQVAFALRVSFAFITETADDPATRVRMLAFWNGKDFGNPFEYGLAGTPCDAVINKGKTCYYPIGVQAMFPQDKDLESLKAQGYIGIPIQDSKGRVIGHLAVLDNKILKIQDRELSVLKIFAERAGVELERMKEKKNPTTESSMKPSE